MKKLLCLILIATVALTSLVSCKPGTTVSSSSSSTSVSEAPMEITWLVYNQIGITPNPDSAVKKLIEERFNVKITIPQVDIHTAEQWNLYWASGNSPDAAFMNNTSSAVFKLVDQSLVRSIPAGYLDEYMPDYMNAIYSLADKAIVNTQISYKGEQYIVPYTGFDTPYIMAIRKDWMDAVGVTKLPTTPDELFELAKKFTFNDPDKNGKNDTYGIHGGSGTRRYMRFGYLNAFYGFWPDSYYNENGKIIYTSTLDTYKESLKYLNTWFKAGVIDPEFATEDRDIQRKKWAEGKFGITLDHPWWFSTSTPGNLTTSMKEANPNAEVVYLSPFMNVKKEQASAAWFPVTSDDGSMFFGKNCTDAKIAKILEIRNSFVTDWDFYVRCMYGVKDTDYTINTDGIIVPTDTSRTPEYMSEQGFYAFNICPLSYETQKKYTMTKDDVAVYDFAKVFKPIYVYQNFNFPGLNESYAAYNADIASISDEFYYNAIMGKVDIDTGFEEFKEALANANLQKVLDEYQAGLAK